jgi:hypothetical protein
VESHVDRALRTIESAILRAGVAPSFETGLAAYLVVEALSDAQLGWGHDAIVDAVNAVEWNVERVMEWLSRA